MSEERVVTTVEDRIATVTLNRPEKRNGMDLEMFDGLVEAGLAVAKRNDVRAVVLHGAGKSFCAGLDWQSFLMAGPEVREKMLARPSESPANLAQRCCWVWQEVPVPVIAAVHGAAMGGGLQLALGADVRIVAPDAQLSVMEAKYGLVPDMGATRTLLGLVREDVARELTFTARVVSGTEAVSLGLATRVADDPLAAARELATEIAGRSPHAVRAAKRLYQGARGLSTREAFELETREQLALLGSSNQMEAAMAAMQKREPSFTDPE